MEQYDIELYDFSYTKQTSEEIIQELINIPSDIIPKFKESIDEFLKYNTQNYYIQYHYPYDGITIELKNGLYLNHFVQCDNNITNLITILVSELEFRNRYLTIGLSIVDFIKKFDLHSMFNEWFKVELTIDEIVLLLKSTPPSEISYNKFMKYGSVIPGTHEWEWNFEEINKLSFNNMYCLYFTAKNSYIENE